MIHVNDFGFEMQQFDSLTSNTAATDENSNNDIGIGDGDGEWANGVNEDIQFAPEYATEIFNKLAAAPPPLPSCKITLL